MPDATNYTVTKCDFTYFKREVLKWVREFGLVDYDVEVRLGNPKRENAVASTEWDVQGRWSVIRLATEGWDEPPTRKVLRTTAFHEVMHLLLAPLGYEGRCRFTSAGTMDEIEEGIVVRLENFYRRVVCKEKI